MKTKIDIEKKIINDYLSNKFKILEISKKYNISRQTIRKIIIRNGINLKSKNLSKNIKLQIIKKYQSGICNKKLSKIYNVHRATIQKILLDNKIKLRKQEETSRKKFLLNFNNGIKTNNDAYLLGLIYSDGNLYKNAIDICLHKKDKELLLNISNYVYGKNTIKYRDGKLFKHGNKQYKSNGQYRFTISSKQVSNILRKIGLCENKSLKIRFPQLDEIFISHFIRGFFDGDGCIFVSKKYKRTNRVTIVSNYLFCNDLKKQIESFLNINVYVNFKTKNVGLISITGNNQIIKFMDWIYKDADLKLKRKYKKYYNEYKKNN